MFTELPTMMCQVWGHNSGQVSKVSDPVVMRIKKKDEAGQERGAVGVGAH